MAMTKEELTEVLRLHRLWVDSSEEGERADLRSANLQGADLRGADLRGADLQGAKLQGAKLRGFQIPQEGSLIVWKKIRDVLIKLRIPKHAKRTACLVSRKCRAEYAEILEVQNDEKQVTGGHAGFTYVEGESAHPDSYDDDPCIECTHGIHFFLTEEEARAY